MKVIKSVIVLSCLATLGTSSFSAETPKTVMPNPTCHMIQHGFPLPNDHRALIEQKVSSPYEGPVAPSVLFPPAKLDNAETINEYEIDFNDFMTRTNRDFIPREDWYKLKEDRTSYNPSVDVYQYYYQYLRYEFPEYFPRAKM